MNNRLTLNQGGTIPSSFKLCCHEIKIEIVDVCPDGDYGWWHDAACTIYIARKVPFKDGFITLTDEQMQNTLWHEIFHCFQFFMSCNYDETQAQTFANFMREFINSTEMPF